MITVYDRVLDSVIIKATLGGQVKIFIGHIGDSNLCLQVTSVTEDCQNIPVKAEYGVQI